MRIQDIEPGEPAKLKDTWPLWAIIVLANVFWITIFLW
jgi:hypothetical protein